MRLDRWLTTLGMGSRSEVQRLIRSGAVAVAGETVRDPGMDCATEVTPLRVRGESVDGRTVRHVMLHKPEGLLTAARDRKQPTVMDMLPMAYAAMGCMPVGRLDKDSEGLLLFTNDGTLTQQLLHPRHQVDKVYQVTVSGALEGAEERLSRMRMLEGEPIQPAQVRRLSQKGETAVLEVIIHQGKNRQIRRMCRQAGLSVLRLRRVQEHTLHLGNLPSGKWRYLTDEELQDLKGSDGVE